MIKAPTDSQIVPQLIRFLFDDTTLYGNFAACIPLRGDGITT
jgi:hypothetical protein